MKSIEVVAAIITQENKIFCAQRSLQKSLAGKWEFPGGKIEPGETHQNALIREIKEEFNTEITVDDYFMTVEHEYDSFKVIMHAYFATIIDGNMTLNEHIDFRWMSRENLNELDFAEADCPIVKKLMNM